MIGVSTILGKMFGSTETINKGIDALTSGLDKLYYSSEEKAADGAADRAEARSLIISWMQATSSQNIARRVLAFMIAGTWLLMYLISTVLDVSINWVSPELIEKIALSASAIGDRASQMNGAMMLILGFYFAAPHLSTIVPAAMAKFSKSKEQKNVDND